MSQEDLMMAMVTNAASLTSRTSMSVVIVGGVVSCTLMKMLNFSCNVFLKQFLTVLVLFLLYLPFPFR